MSEDTYLRFARSSREMFEKARNYLPGGVSYTVRFFEPHPFYVSRAEGQYVWDLDGNRYLDFWMGHGALLMGHRYPRVIEAMRRQLEEFPHVGLPHEWEVRLAEQVARMVPSVEMIRFTNSGTEANMYAVRLARAYTGREVVGKFEGNWHGGYDALHIAVTPPYEEPGSLGIARGALKDTLILPYNDLEGVEEALRGVEPAALVVEPVAGAGGFIPATKEFLKGLRELCDEKGALLIFDEVITGFRLSPGGAQQLYGVKPDLTVFGKIIGGGETPVGAFGGKRDVMELLDQLKHPVPHRRSFQGGTFAANPMTTRAGYTLLKELSERPEVYEKLNNLGEKMRKGLEEAFQREGVSAYATGVGSMAAIHFIPEPPKDVKTAQTKKNRKLANQYFKHLLGNGVLCLIPETQHFFISAAHTLEDVEKVLDVTEGFAKLVAPP